MTPRAFANQLTTVEARRLLPPLYVLAIAAVFVLRVPFAVPYVVGFGWTAAITLIVALLAVVIVGLVPIEARTVIRTTAAVALGFVILSGAVVGALVALGALTLSAGLGRAIVARRAVGPPTPLELLYGLAVGAAVMSYAALALALTGLLTAPAVGVAVVAAAISTRSQVITVVAAMRNGLRIALGTPRGRAGPILILACGWALLVLVQAVAPETQYDSLNYHLGLPRVWIDAARFVSPPDQPQSFQYLGSEVDMAVVMLFGGQVAAKLLCFAWLGVGVGAIASFCARELDRRIAALAAALYLATPAIAWGGGTTYVDVIVATLAFLAATAWYAALARNDRSLAATAGLIGGFAIATKLTAVVAVMPLVLLVVMPGLASITARSRAALVAAFAVPALAMPLPWALLRWIETGNPVFPLLNAFFQSPLYPPTNATSRFGIGVGPLDLLRLPFDLSYATELFDEQMHASDVGIGLLLLPIALVVRPSRPVRYLAAFAGVTFLAWALSAQYARYGLPMVGPLSILAAVALGDLPAWLRGLSISRSIAALPLVVILGGLPWWIALYPHVPGAIPYAVATGLQTRQQYLETSLPTYRALQLTDRASVVLLVSDDPRADDDEDRLYAQGSVVTRNTRTAATGLAIQGEDAAVAWLHDRGFTHVLVDRLGLPAGTADALVLRPSFLARVGTLIFSDGPVELYRLGLP